MKPFEDRLRKYLTNPNVRNWDDLYSAIIPGTMRTVWQSWVKIDSSAPSQKPTSKAWKVIPNPFTVRRAIRAAMKGDVPIGLGELLSERGPAVPGIKPSLSIAPQNGGYTSQVIAKREARRAFKKDADSKASRQFVIFRTRFGWGFARIGSVAAVEIAAYGTDDEETVLELEGPFT